MCVCVCVCHSLLGPNTNNCVVGLMNSRPTTCSCLGQRSHVDAMDARTHQPLAGMLRYIHSYLERALVLGEVHAAKEKCEALAQLVVSALQQLVHVFVVSGAA